MLLFPYRILTVVPMLDDRQQPQAEPFCSYGETELHCFCIIVIGR